MSQMRPLVLSVVAKRSKAKGAAKWVLRICPHQMRCVCGGLKRLESGGFRRHARSPLGESSSVRECRHLVLSVTLEVCGNEFVCEETRDLE